MSYPSAKYTSVAIVLHWIIAGLIIIMIPMGFIMGEDDIVPASLRFPLYQLHKSIGLTILVLTAARVVWRLTHRPPALPAGMKTWEKWASHAVHIGFYGLMVGLPMTGWALVSSSPRNIPTQWFGLFQWPHLPVLPDLANKGEMAESFSELHESLAWIAVVLLALHVGAALKHHLIVKDDVLTRMIPFLKPRNP